MTSITDWLDIAQLGRLRQIPATIFDPEWLLVFMSEPFAQLVGMPAEELLGKPAPPPWCPPQYRNFFSGSLGRVLGTHRFQTTVLHRDGSGVPVDVEYEQLTSTTREDVLHLVHFQPLEEAPPVADPEELQRIATLSAELTALLASLRDRIGPSALVGRAAPNLGGLSIRERQVTDLLLEGRRPVEIAGVLHISPHTVRNHVKSVFRKLGVHSHVELLREYRPAHGNQE